MKAVVDKNVTLYKVGLHSLTVHSHNIAMATLHENC